jgi:enterochelin esterase-like enzyme
MKRFLILILITLSTNLYCQNKEFNKNVKFTEVIRPYMTISPFISDLLKLDNQDFKQEIKKLWLNAKEGNLPLIESDSLDSDYKYLTLIYQENSENKEVSFEVKGIYDEYRLGDMKLRRMQNSDLYYRCYKIPNDICFAYRYIVKDTISGNEIKAIDKFNLDLIPRGQIYNISYSVIDLRSNEIDWNAKRYDNLNSKIDTIKYTDSIVKKDRNIYVYLPPNYDKNRKKPYPIIYLFDAFLYLNRVEVPNILDNIITEKKIEPMIAVFFGTYRKSRRIILPLNFEFKNEFVTKVVPLIREKYNTSLNPNENIIGGMSYGGLAAGFIGFYHSNIFGKVFGQSSSFWRDFELTDSDGEWMRNDWLINKYSTSNKKELKFYLDWGLQENWVLGSNRRMVKVLNKKEYEVKFVEFNGWHDWSNSRKTFADGLMYLLD